MLQQEVVCQHIEMSLIHMLKQAQRIIISAAII